MTALAPTLEAYFTQRLIGQRRMEEREAAPVFSQPAPQIVPAANFMYRFMGNQLLQHERRRAPVDTLQPKKSAIKPRTQQMAEIGIYRLELRTVGK